MNRLAFVLLALLFAGSVVAQPSIRNKKYPSLLWEISGNGLKKPSYLIGTMHVSSKIAFNLPDSFYYAIRQADMVALETNPETWQEDMSLYDFGDRGYTDNTRGYVNIPSQYLTINTLKFYKYDNKIQRSLYSNPSTINNLLYRSFGNASSDFEEDTYLDMYIFQVGRKWKKKVAGVENYAQSMKLMAEAYQDAARDKNKKQRSYTDFDEEYSSDKLQEAYRSGDLDLLDSINKYNSQSAAFDEKFLYRRNEIQAESMDSIIRSGTVLFAGVGAAHLPGDRGVIEILRSKGYRVRPIKMGQRASREKDLVDKIRVPVTFRTETAPDGMYRVEIPGKFYKFGDDAALDQLQYADMANGSYYMVTRILTNSWMWSHSTDQVYRTIDSLLYENIPGRIISKTPITRNGYKGLDIVNRTRRGDVQRYNIFITPFEIIFFKIGGNSEYVLQGEEAKKFFASIQLREYKVPATQWKKYSPSYGGFSVVFPHDPFVGNDGSWLYDAEDKNSNTHYRIVRSAVHNYHFVEEDSFDLGLMDESFMASEFIDSQFHRKQTTYQGYPALDGKYRDKNGGVYLARFIIQGPNYYSVIAHGKQETSEMKSFLNSFEVKPFIYPAPKKQVDTSLYYSVTTPVYPESKKIKLDIPQDYYDDDSEEIIPEDELLEAGAFRSKVIQHDSTNEKIFVAFYRAPRYYRAEDSAMLGKDYESALLSDSNWIIRSRKSSQLPNGLRIWELVLSDTGSSRSLWAKAFYKDGNGFSLLSQGDTLTAPSTFVSSFYETFMPSDTLKGSDPFTSKSKLFFDDLASSDTLVHKRAIKYIDIVKFDSTDLQTLRNAITTLNWEEKNYLNVKRSLIGKMSSLNSRASSEYLKHLYYSLGDTVQLQYAVLETLLEQKTAISFKVFREIITTEPPVLDLSSPGSIEYSYESYQYGTDNFLSKLSDTLQLARTILPDLLPLINLDDYKDDLMELLATMVDSNLVKPSDYEQFFSKFLLEAKHELRKQAISEKRKAIQLAEQSKIDKKANDYDNDSKNDAGNTKLNLYARLLLPFWKSQATVQPLFRQMLASEDKRLRYNIMILMLQHKLPYPDSLINYFAGLDEYRYELYSDIKDKKLSAAFPSKYQNHLDLARSVLLSQYEKPDTVAYLDRILTSFKDNTGFVYFYKYKIKRDDLTWKIASVGLIPQQDSLFEFVDKKGERISVHTSDNSKYNFSSLTDQKLKEESGIGEQLRKELKKLIFSKRNSAAEFYEEEREYNPTIPIMD